VRRSDLTHLTNLTAASTAVAVALGIASLVTALWRVVDDLHGFLDSAWIVSSILAATVKIIQKLGDDRRRVRGTPPLTPEDVARAVDRTLKAHHDGDGERLRPCG